MCEHRPPSPPPSNNGDYHYGFHHLGLHNGVAQCPISDPFRDNEMDGSFRSHSGYPSAYSSPGPMVQEQMTRRPSYVDPRYAVYGDDVDLHGSPFVGGKVCSCTDRHSRRRQTLTSFPQRPLPQAYHTPNGVGAGGAYVSPTASRQLHLAPADSSQSTYNGYPQMPYHSPPQPYGCGDVSGGPGVSIPIPRRRIVWDLTTKTQYPQQSHQTESPPTPNSSDNSIGGHYTRSGRFVKSTAPAQAARPNTQQSRMTPAKASRVRKNARQAKGSDRPKLPKLTAPLSELTRSYKETPIKDMDAWVQRSAETRHKEVAGRHGYITRPMNSFMLYRSAFAERTKIWCVQNNHQIVSSVSGESWPLEPPEVRDKYDTLARIERENHQLAHPGYKFSPSKAQASAKKKKKKKGGHQSDEDEQSEPSDLDDMDYDWGSSRKRKSKSKSKKKSQRPESRESCSMNSSPFNNSRYQTPQGGLVRTTSYQMQTPPKPLPQATSHQHPYGQYDQTAVQRSQSTPNVDNVSAKNTDGPGAYHGTYPPLTGLPGGMHQDLVQHHGVPSSQMGGEALDPQLLAYDGGFLKAGTGHGVENHSTTMAGGHPTIEPPPSFDPVIGAMDPFSPSFLRDWVEPQEQNIDVHQLPGYHNSMQVATDNMGSWHIEPDHGSEFEQWMGPHHQN